MNDRARVHLLTQSLSAKIDMQISVCDHQSWPTKANLILFSLLDLRSASGAPEQELILHTTFGKHAKRLEHLIELSVRQWCNYVW